MKTGVSYFGNRHVNRVVEDLNDMKAHHCNAVLHTLSEEDVEFYLDTMKEIVRVSHARGFEVYNNPWGYGGTFGGESYSRFCVNNVEAGQKDNQGRLLPAACLNHPGYRKYLKEWIEAVTYVDGDAVFWDEPHFYILKPEEGWSCRCEICQAKFKDGFGHDMPQDIGPEVIKFKCESMIDFLKEMTSYAKEKGLRNNICLLPPLYGPGGYRGGRLAGGCRYTGSGRDCY